MSKKNLGTSQSNNRAMQSDWSVRLSLLRSILTFVFITFMLQGSVVQAFKIPSSSMVPTLEIGDHILVNKLSYGLRLPFKAETVFDYRLPTRDDVVVFTLSDDSSTNIIKRVVGLPGDQIEIRGTKLYINGELYEDDYRHAIWVHGGRNDFGPVTVPEGHVLLLGDNRDESRDSRLWPETFLPIDRIKGRAFLVYWNLGAFDRMFNVID